jgi:FKBP-type peptidyl-prolyl cis-trans isomerase FkpA
MKKLVLILFLISTVFACKTYSDDDKKLFDDQIQSYLQKKNIHCRHTASGLYYNILKPGEGKNIQYQDVVRFSYKGYLLNGNIFDDEKKPVEFAVKDLIVAWKEIMLELKPGAEVLLITPPQLAYGNHELDDIPKNSILIFEMKIASVK